MTAATLVSVVGAVIVVATVVFLTREAIVADRRADQWRRAYNAALRELVVCQTDLTIARMLHGGEVDRLRRQLDDR